jgi:hypothetical protein
VPVVLDASLVIVLASGDPSTVPAAILNSTRSERQAAG